MVRAGEYNNLPMELKLLHEDVRRLEAAQQADCYMVKVQQSLHFIEDYPTDKIYLGFVVCVCVGGGSSICSTFLGSTHAS